MAPATRGLIATIAVIAGGIVAVLLVTSPRPGGVDPLRTPSGDPATASPSASPAAIAPPTGAAATPSVSPAGAVTTHANAILGYRITLPAGYRRSIARIDTAPGGRGGLDYFTLETEAEARQKCDRDGAHIGGGFESDIRVGVSLETGGMSAHEWATTPRAPGSQPLSTHRKVEQVTVGGHEAVRLVPDRPGGGEAQLYVIRANERIYEIGPIRWSEPSSQPKGWLDDIARTFTGIQPPPFPTPTPQPQPPREAARQLADRLAGAFAARDPDAVARLMPSCWISAFHWIDGKVVGMGPLVRSVSLFRQGLSERFARGDLTVVVDRQVQTEIEGGRERFFVRSEWREPTRVTRADLFLDEIDGRWQWSTARFQLRQADFGDRCTPYPSPWLRPGDSPQVPC